LEGTSREVSSVLPVDRTRLATGGDGMRLIRTPNGSPKWWLSALLIVALVPIFAGCYGSFRTTKAVYKFNGEVSEDKLIKSLAFWGLNIIPVYGIAAFVDVIAFNLVEFWTEGDPTQASTWTDDDGTTYALTPVGDGKSAVMTITRPGEEPTEVRYTRVSDSVVEVADARGTVLRTVSRGDLVPAPR
jgi:hypothetical protein